ncbi:MAG: arylsulfatase [Actinomycetota bacterium]
MADTTGFGGRIGRTMAGSEPHWLSRPTAPKGAPNIIFVLADDVGFADLGCFGAEIRTPNLDRMAAEGVRFSNFHVNPMCSPTRASLLTGINCHAAGMGHIAQDDPGFPGYRAELGSNVATAAEILRDHGYATLMVGKWHLCRDAAMSAGGPIDSWPLQRGFDRFYGILEAFTNLHHPHRLVRDNHVVPNDRYPDGYFLTDDLTEQAISMVREVQASRPGKPFFLYVAHPAAHAPLLAKADDIERYRHTYTVGWDEIRRRRHARQVELGIIDADTVLPPPEDGEVDGVAAWDDLTDTERLVFARYMAVYAAMVDEIDQSMGRLREALEESGQWENTIVVYLSDNGASREGEATGTTNYFAHLAGAPDTVARDAERLDLIGGPQTMSHYPRGWAMAGNTPFRMYKRHTHAGGVQVPCIVHWPAGLAHQTGTIRRQYAHCIDLLPTVLELAGLSAPTEFRGNDLLPFDGISLAPVLADDSHPTLRTEQYYENEGHRGFYRDGWEVVTTRIPRRPFGDHEWELYHLDTDPTETRDLAAEHPELVTALSQGWHEAAVRNNVYPLDEGSGWRWLVRPPDDAVFHEPVTIYAGTPTLERIRCGSLTWQRHFTVTVDVTVAAGDQGVLVAHGDQGGGYSLELREHGLAFVHNDGHGATTRVDAGALSPGRRSVVLRMAAPGGGRWHVTVEVDGEVRTEPFDCPMLWPMAPFSGIDVGIDRSSPIDWARFEHHGPFPYSGHLHSVRYEPGELAPDAPARFTDFLRDWGAKFE